MAAKCIDGARGGTNDKLSGADIRGTNGRCISLPISRRCKHGRDGVDVALRYGPGTWPGVQAERFMEEEIFPVMSPGYGDGVHPRRFSDLAKHRLLKHRSQPWEPWFQAQARLLRLWKRRVTDIYAHFIVWRADNPKRDAIDVLRRWLHDEAR